MIYFGFKFRRFGYIYFLIYYKSTIYLIYFVHKFYFLQLQKKNIQHFKQ